MILRSCTLEHLWLLELWDPDDEMWVGNKREYLRKRLADPFYMFIGSTPGGIPVAWGQIKREYEFTLSWFTAPQYRDEGFGLQMARLLAQMSGRPIRARINVNRPYSERIAIRLGMVPHGALLETGEKIWVGV